MSKQAILAIDYHNIQQPLNLKRQILLFDKIIVEEQSLGLAKTFVNYTPNRNLESFKFNNQEIDFLGAEGYLSIETINRPINVKIDSDEEKFMETLRNESEEINTLLAVLKANPSSGTLTKLMGIIKKLPTSFARALGIRLREEGNDAYPVFDDEPDYTSSGKKEDVLKFLLKQIPEPDDSVSWEQIIDFRNDPDTMKKYYALIKWVNDVSQKEFNTNEIEEEYQYLYHDYSEQYRIHKMKHKQGIIEVLVTAAVDVFIHNLGAGHISSSLFALWKHQLNLLEAEAKFTGREVAYIYKLEQTLKKA